MTPSDIVRYTCVVQYYVEQKKKDGWKGGAYVAEVLKRAVLVERRSVGRVSRWGTQPF